MNDLPCPGRDRWIAFLSGDLPSGEIEQLALHLEFCATCVGLLGECEPLEAGLSTEIRRDLRESPDEKKQQTAAAPNSPPSTQCAAQSEAFLPGEIRCPNCRQFLPGDAIAKSARVICPTCGQAIEIAADRAMPGGQPVRPLTRMGRYELLESLGAGAFGAVWRARDVELDREVAIKVPRPGREIDADAEERFQREARSAAQLKHPHIVSVHDVGRHHETLFMVSDLVRGVSLAEWLRSSPPGFRESAEVVAQIAEALAYAHAKGVVHRDLKPANVMLEIDGAEANALPTGAPSAVAQRETAKAGGSTVTSQPKQPSRSLAASAPFCVHIMDFGLAKRDAGDVTVTVDGQILGTPAYMSPEQIRNPHAVDGRGDLYSVGVILYEMLTGELPFRGVTRMVLHQALHDEPRPPRKLNDRIPRDLETITLKCCAKEPARRFQCAQELVDDLRRYLRNEPIHARPVGALGRAWRWSRRNPLSSALVTVIALVTGAGVSATLLQARRAESARQESSVYAGLATDSLQTLIRDVGEGLDNLPQARGLRSQVLEQSVTTLDRLAKMPGARQQAEDLLAMNHRVRGDIHLSRLELQAAETQYREALALSDHSPDRSSANIEPAIAAMRLGTVYVQMRRFADAKPFLESAIELFTPLATGDDADVWVVRHLVAAHLALASVELFSQRPRQGADAAKRCVELARRLANQPDTKYIGELGVAAGMTPLSVSLDQLGETEQARRRFEEGRGIIERLLLLDQNSYAAQFEGGVLFHERGKFLEKHGELAEARLSYQRCLELLHRMALADPSAKNQLNKQALVEVGGRLGRIAEHDGAAFFHAARAYAHAAQLAADGKGPNERSREQNVMYLQSALSAVELLKQSREHGYFQQPDHVVQMIDAPEFAVLQHHPEYQRLVSELSGGPD